MFWQEKHMREKPRISYVFGVSGAHAWLLSTFDRPYVVHSTSRAAGDFRRRSRPTWPKIWIIPVRGERAFTLAKTSEKPTEFQKTTLRRWVFRFEFFAVFRGCCLATSNKKRNVRKILVFLCQCKWLFWREKTPSWCCTCMLVSMFIFVKCHAPYSRARIKMLMSVTRKNGISSYILYGGNAILVLDVHFLYICALYAHCCCLVESHLCTVL